MYLPWPPNCVPSAAWSVPPNESTPELSKKSNDGKEESVTKETLFMFRMCRLSNQNYLKQDFIYAMWITSFAVIWLVENNALAKTKSHKANSSYLFIHFPYRFKVFFFNFQKSTAFPDRHFLEVNPSFHIFHGFVYFAKQCNYKGWKIPDIMDFCGWMYNSNPCH